MQKQESDISYGDTTYTRRDIIPDVPSIASDLSYGDTTVAKIDDKVSMMDNNPVSSRKEIEEATRDEAERFEVKMKNLYTTLEDGRDVTMWQINAQSDFGDAKCEFDLQNTQVQIKLQQKGQFLVHAVLAFNKSIGQQTYLEPLSLNEILEVKAGCDGHNPSEFSITGKVASENGSLFLTLKAATSTPGTSARLHFLKCKSTSARNNLLIALRGLLADLQIKEGVHISSIINNTDMDTERTAYGRALFLMLQGASDLKDSEKETMGLRSKMDEVMDKLKKKDKDIMQYRNKIENLLMDNEDLREHKENYKNHLILMQSETLDYRSAGSNLADSSFEIYFYTLSLLVLGVFISSGLELV